jgi:hypothetical protein
MLPHGERDTSSQVDEVKRGLALDAGLRRRDGFIRTVSLPNHY